MSEPVFDERLMTAERLLKLAGNHPTYLDRDEDDLFARLRCCLCDGQIEILMDVTGRPYPLTAKNLLTATLRHLVMHHDQPLSGKANDNGRWTDPRL